MTACSMSASSSRFDRRPENRTDQLDRHRHRVSLDQIAKQRIFNISRNISEQTPPGSNGEAAHTHSNCLLLHSASPTKGGAPEVNRIAACLTRYDLHQSVTYQPASHYWPLQWYETGIFLALAAALSGTSFWWIRHRLT